MMVTIVSGRLVVGYLRHQAYARATAARWHEVRQKGNASREFEYVK
jgi:hypothetical protein